MHLLDRVAQANKPLIVNVAGMPNPWPLPGCNIVAPQLRECALRFVLQDDVTELCTELAFEADSIIGTSVEILRVPAPRLWLEFCGRARQKAFQEFGRLNDAAAPDDLQRVGYLVSSDEKGRKGTIDVCWDGPEMEDLAPFVIEFDFDDDGFSDVGRSTTDGACIGANIADHPALVPLFKHVRFNLRPEWCRYYIEQAESDVHYRQVLEAAVRPLFEDVPFFAVFCLLLMSRSALQEKSADRTKLNKARQRRGRPPLLDHVELSMNLGAVVPAGDGAGLARSSPRLHFVRGHLVRRGAAVFWRMSHMRGKPSLGVIRSRTVSLQLAGHPAF